MYGFNLNNTNSYFDSDGNVPRGYVPHPDPSMRYYRDENGKIIKRHVKRIEPWFGKPYYDYNDQIERPAGPIDPYEIDDEGTPQPSTESERLGLALRYQFDEMTTKNCCCVVVTSWVAMAAIVTITPTIITSSQGFLLGGIPVRLPFAIKVVRYGGVACKATQHWAIALPNFVINSPVLSRALLAILTQWNQMSRITTGVIPAGTRITIGGVGPQVWPGQSYPGGWIQILVESGKVIEQTTKCLK